MKMEQTRQQIREMLATYAHYAQVEALWNHLRAKMEEDIKAKQDKLCADWAKTDAN
jgi:alkylhydroperoxidase/carboxymuconolactone decarboxylase family protein YurZ